MFSMFHVDEEGSPNCPLADLETTITIQEKGMMVISNEGQKGFSKCPYHAHVIPSDYKLTDQSIPLKIENSTHKVSDATAQLLLDIGGGDRIREFCTRFYARAFVDKVLKPFFFLDDGAPAHAKRLGDWIIEKMGGEGSPWSESGRYGMRQPSHYKAWNSDKRDPEVRGNHFSLTDTRVWIRLHFWAIRECGLDKHEAFWEWYIQFIEHFIGIYERRAPLYVKRDSLWSANISNIDKYLKNDFVMLDIIGRASEK